MRIATWNLGRCRAGASPRAGKLLALMTHVAADVWVLTETWRDFSPGPGYQLVAHSVDAADRNAARGECWVAVWSQNGPVRRLRRDMDEGICRGKIGMR